MSLPVSITIEGTEYATAALSEDARIQIANVQAADAEIANIQRQLALIQTARNAYFQALLGALKSKEDAGAKKPAKKAVSTKAKKPAA